MFDLQFARATFNNLRTPSLLTVVLFLNISVWSPHLKSEIEVLGNMKVRFTRIAFRSSLGSTRFEI